MQRARKVCTIEAILKCDRKKLPALSMLKEDFRLCVYLSWKMITRSLLSSSTA
jgi:hypothetical protein